MHDIEPHYQWRDKYTAEEDDRSPFYGTEHSEFEFSNAVYDHVVHPQWDSFGSTTLYMKVIFADYDDGYVIIELIGEWNDLLHNDIMVLKRDIIEELMAQGINKFILIGENVLNFHSSDEEYYAEWYDEVSEQDGWIALINFRLHVLDELQHADIDQYFLLGGKLNAFPWRAFEPEGVFANVQDLVVRRLGL
ncbi:MAG: hypothetical protein IPO10_06085 [Flavobacteriales bacterium]|nr:hypothetical protein [Flavobacteriales bacterium]